MADKKALVILASSAELGSGAGVEKLLKKAALMKNYTAGEVFGASVAAADVTKIQPADVEAAVEKGTALMCVDLGSADAAALDAALVTILDAADRKTVVAVVAKNALALYGSAVNSKAGSVDRAATANDVIPTLAYIADFAITSDCTGAILYQALKSPNLKMDEMGKLKEALVRMEGALARDNREPWDKHDCA